jgi:hypothetical protein
MNNKTIKNNNNSIQDSEGKEENGYSVSESNKTIISDSKEHVDAQKTPSK